MISMRQEKARLQYKPTKIRCLLLTEAPPPDESERFFYYEQVPRGDSFFLETIKVLFPEEYKTFDTVKEVRAHKTYFLERLQEVGFYVLSAYPESLKGHTAAQRIRKYRQYWTYLIGDLTALIKPSTPIILISAVVYQALATNLSMVGFNVLNEGQIEFPNSGQQGRFKTKFSRLVNLHQLSD